MEREHELKDRIVLVLSNMGMPNGEEEVSLIENECWSDMSDDDITAVIEDFC